MRKNILILAHNEATQFIDINNQYTRLFDKNKFHVTVAYLSGKANDTVKQRTIADEVIFLEFEKKHIRNLKVLPVKKLLNLTRQKNFHIVICHRYKPSYIMMMVALFYKIPALICVMHELNTMTAFGRQLVVRFLARSNTLFAGVSNAVRDDLRNCLSFLPSENIITLYNCIDVDLTQPHLHSRDDARKQLNIPPETFLFGTLGRLVPNKDQVTLINAFAMLKKMHSNAKLIIMGEGILEQELKQQVATLNLTNDVIFTGFVANGYQYMPAFDCFVLTSTQEAFGRVLIEAMIAKLPIIATKANGIPEVMGNTGYLIAPKDVDGIAHAMQEVLSTSLAEREKLGETAYQHVMANFSIPAFDNQFWQIPLLKTLKEEINEDSLHDHV